MADEILSQHPFFSGMSSHVTSLLARVAKQTSFAEGDFIMREGERADRFFILVDGQISLEVMAPDRGALTVSTLGEGEVLGWSWLFPPYRWHFDARAVRPTRMLAFDAAYLREECEKNCALGYELMKRVASVLVDRLQATRLQLLNIYGE